MGGAFVNPPVAAAPRQKAPLGIKGAHEARALCAEQREVSPMKQGVPQASLRAQWYDHAELRNAVGASRLRGSRSLRHGLRRATSLFPSGKRRLLDGAASCDSSTSQKAPFSQKGSCRRQPTEGFPPSLSAKLTEGLSPFAISKAHWHCPCIKSHFPRLKLFLPFPGI